MSGKTHRVKPLELRKQLLLQESELNRVRLLEEWDAVADQVRVVGDRAKSLGLIASATAALVSAVAAFKGRPAAEPGAKRSRFRKVLASAGLIANVWLAVRSKRRGSDGS